jgi:AcrR family transcriptional regulator
VPQASHRLRRADPREQILAAATRAFARTGFAATSLDDVVAAAGVSRVLLYRQCDSKRDLYRAVLDRVCMQLATTVGTEQFSADSIPKLLRAASLDPDGFRLLFRIAAWEPDFREFTDALSEEAAVGRWEPLGEESPLWIIYCGSIRHS